MIGGLGMQFLISDDSDGKAPDAGIATNQRLAIFCFVLIKAAAIDNARNNFLGVIRLRG